MNVFEMIVAIVAFTMIAGVLKARYTWRSRDNEAAPAVDAENQRLREELRSLKERLAVLERLATDNNSSSATLDREIEKLRDRP